jgi:hypothetical protein
MELACEAKRPAAGLGAPALLGEQNRLLDQRLRPVELQTGQVDARELVGSLALEVLPPGLARERDRLLHHPLLLGEVAARPGDSGARAEGSEAAGEIFGLQDVERPVDHLLGGHHVGVAQDDGLGEGHECSALCPAVAGVDRGG